MPVMGRFRLRRESRRAFLQSGFAVKGPVHSFAENLIYRLLRALCLRESRSAGVPSALCLKCSILDLPRARANKLSIFPSLRASADYFRGRSFTNEITLLRRT